MDTNPSDLASSPGSARVGIKGWLAVFIVVQAALLLAFLAATPFQFIYLHDGLTAMVGWMPPPLGLPGVWQYALFRFGAFLWFTSGTAYGLYLVLRRRPAAPWFWRRFLALMLGLLAAAVVWDLLTIWRFGGRLGAGGQLVVRAAVIAIVLTSLLYWRRSRRVQETFAG